jgi:hypothetical protein
MLLNASKATCDISLSALQNLDGHESKVLVADVQELLDIRSKGDFGLRSVVVCVR